MTERRTTQIKEDATTTLRLVALNALLMGCYPPDAAKVLPFDECPESIALRRGVQVLDLQTLACRNRGVRTLILHAAGRPKPWITKQGIQRTAYVRLLRRLLSGSDVAVRVDPGSVPAWLRADVRSRGLLWANHFASRGDRFQKRLRWAVRRRLPI